jgi:CRISPR-associated protein Cmr6
MAKNKETSSGLDVFSTMKIDSTKGITIEKTVETVPKKPQSSESPAPNVGWLYYKDYYKENLTHKTFFDDDAKKTRQKSFFEAKNEKLLNTKSKSIQLNVKPSNTLAFKTGLRGLLVGTGITHRTDNIGEFKLGLQFDYTSGMPYLPGSGIKGLLRACFLGTKEHLGKEYRQERMELMSQIFNKKDNGEELKERLEAFLKEKNIQEKLENDTYFERFLIYLENLIFEGTIGENPIPMSKRSIFFDAFPSKDNQKLLSKDIITPHKNPLENPVPLPFMTIAPDVFFDFSFQLHDSKLMLATEQEEIFRILIETFGVGAKRRKGYGAMIYQPKTTSTNDQHT